MKQRLRASAWRLAVFVAVCLAGTFALVAIFGEMRFNSAVDYRAVFNDASGLKEGNFVRVAGVEVGKVRTVTLNTDSTVTVDFTADPSVPLNDGTRAAIRYDNLVGGRFVELLDGPGSPRRMTAGQTIPIDRTEPALNLDALIGGFRPLFRALNPDQINALTGQIIAVFQGQGDTISSLLDESSALTGALADHDQLIGDVINNLNVVMKSLATQRDKFATAVDTLSQLVSALAQRRDDVTNSVAYGNAAAASLADLLTHVRAPLQKTIVQTDRVSTVVADDRDYVDNLLATLPDAYQKLARQGLYGDFFNAYLCDLTLKMNGKGGQPVYIKVLGQPTGRCTPK